MLCEGKGGSSRESHRKKSDNPYTGACRVKIFIGVAFKVDEEPVLQFLWKVEIVIVCAAVQEISVGDY